MHDNLGTAKLNVADHAQDIGFASLSSCFLQVIIFSYQNTSFCVDIDSMSARL